MNVPSSQNQNPDFNALFQSMELGVVYQNREGQIIASNPATEKILGLSSEQIRGRTSADPRWHAIHEDGTDFPGEIHPSMVALKTGKPVHNVVMGVFNPREDNYRWILINAVPEFRNHEKEPYQVYTTINDITDLKNIRHELDEHREMVNWKMREIKSPTGDLGSLELSDLIDREAVQKLMDEFYNLTKLPMSLVDLKGNVLVGIGWQDICTEFHRKHPDSCKNCVFSDTILTGTIEPGTYRMYRCLNNMWDVASPFMLEGRRFGNIFMGQFFFDDETIDYELFRNQAATFGFDVQAYMGALKKTPVLSRETVEHAMKFFMSFSTLLSAQGLNLIRLQRSVTEKDLLYEDKSRSEERFHRMVQDSEDLIAIINADGTVRNVSPAVYKILGYTPGEREGKNIFSLLHPEDVQKMQSEFVKTLQMPGGSVKHKVRLLHRDGSYRIIEASARNYLADDAVNGIIVNAKDITAHTLIEEKLRNSEQHYRNFFERDITGDYLSTPEGKLIDCNTAFVKMLGYDSKDELLLMNMDRIYPQQVDRETFLRKLQEQKVLIHFNCDLVRRDGRLINCIENVIGIFDEDGKLIFFQGYMMDITGQKEAMEQLRISEERLSFAMEATNDGLWDWNLETNQAYFSPRYYQMLGYEPGEFEANYENWKKLIHPDDLKEIEPVINKAIQHVRDYSVEFRMKTKSGKWNWILGRGKVASSEPGGRPTRMIGTHIDISERKAAEERLKTSDRIFNHSIDMLCIAGFDGYFKVLNPSWEKILGWTTEELLSKPWNDFVHPNDVNATNNVKSTIVDGHEIFHFENRYLCKSGEYKWLSWNSFPYAAEKIMFGVARDITETKKSQKALEDSETNFKTFFNTIRDFLFILDEQGHIKEVNQTVSDRLGYEKSELLNKPVLIVHPAERREESAQIIEEMIRGTRNFCPVPLITKEGVEISVETYITSGFWNGERALFGVSRDITALRLSEQKFATAFHASPVIMGMSTIDTGSFIEVNQAFCDKLGYTSEEVIGKRSVDILRMNPDIRKKMIQDLKNYGILRNVETAILNKKEETIHLLLSAEIIEINNRRVNFTSAIDISDRIRAESALRENEERFRLLVKNVASIIVIINADGTQRYVSPPAEKITGFTPEELTGKKFADVIHPDDLLQILSSWNECINQPDKIFIARYRHIHKTQGWVYLEATAQNFLNEPSVHAVIAVVREIAEQMRSEKLHKIQYNIAHAVATSKSLKELLVVVKQELNQIIDTTNFFIAFYNETTRMLRNAFWADEKEHYDEWPADHSLSGIVVTEGKPLFLMRDEISALARNRGIELWGTPAEFWMGVPLVLRNRVIGAMVVQTYDKQYAFEDYSREVFDIVANQISLYIEKLKDEEELITAKIKAEQSDKLKTSFLRNMSHEIRTPLNGIMGFTSLLKNFENLTNNEKKTYTSMILSSSERLLSIVDGVMELSKLESGTMKADVKNVSISVIIDRIYRLYEPRVAAKALDFKVQLPEDISKIVLRTDGEKLFLILKNFLENAIKFTNTGGIEIIIRHVKSDVSINIHDTGIGIEKDFHVKIFERFWQHEAFTKEFYGGTGLGLPIAKGLADLLGFEIIVDSEPGKGSTFTLLIPEAVIADSTGEIVMDTDKSEPLPYEPENIHILVAEDDETNFHLIEHMFNRKTVRITWVTDGRQALEKVLHENFDLVLMDLKMPVMNGFEATEQIRKYNIRTPVIALTAYSLIEDREKAMILGCNDFISKPVKKRELMEKIQKCCNVQEV